MSGYWGILETSILMPKHVFFSQKRDCSDVTDAGKLQYDIKTFKKKKQTNKTKKRPAL